MLWWFLILAASTAVVVLVATTLYVQVRRQMKNPATGQKREADDRKDHLSPPEA
jgi:flagellar biosynthesis/type III secretory pathway M-ring protein FliF/YscJ